MRIRVLMIGPGQGVVSGISSFVRALIPVLEQHVDLQYLVTIQDRPIKESGRFSIRNIWLVISQFVRFLIALFRFHPKIIHLHTSQGMGWLKDTYFVLIGKACGCRIILHVHGSDIVKIHNKSHRSIQIYTKRAIKYADVVIAVSSELSRCLAEIVPADSIYTLKNCIAVDEIPYRSHYSTVDSVNALFLGVIGPSKGVYDLLHAMAVLKNRGCPLQLWIAGLEEREGDLEKARAQTDKLDLKDVCHFVGAVFGDSKSQLLRDARLFVLPSYHEAFPMALLEAMAAGLPIVATRVGGIPEVVVDGYNGFLVDPGDVETLAEKLALLTEDPQLCRRMGQLNRNIAEQELGVDTYVAQLVQLYQNIV